MSEQTQETAVEVSYADAIRLALEHAMEQDESITLLGQDIAIGFPFGVTKGLIERFGAERVRDTPISEAGTMGCGVGAAVHGLRTVVEVDFSGFLMLGMDQLVNNAAKLRYMSAGQMRVPLVVRVGQGPLGSFGAQHSQALHGWLANVPGLVVCAPGTVQDAYDLMRWALRQDDPVVFAEDMRLYRVRGQLVGGGEDVQLGARVARPGRDATAVVFGYDVPQALEAAETLAAEGIEL
jgi:acetoin:2,6-dichlorophenolindophenol oxidoreductase subunit beta